jgi:hypothetical protein
MWRAVLFVGRASQARSASSSPRPSITDVAVIACPSAATTVRAARGLVLASDVESIACVRTDAWTCEAVGPLSAR